MASPHSHKELILEHLQRANSIDQSVSLTGDVVFNLSSMSRSSSSSSSPQSEQSVFYDVPSNAPSESPTPRFNTPTSSNKLFPRFSMGGQKISFLPKPEKHISFSNRCSVVLIPTRKEYLSAGLGLDLWVSRQEQLAAQQEVTDEVRGVLECNPALTMRQATSFLYQPKVTSEEEEEDDECVPENECFRDDESIFGERAKPRMPRAATPMVRRRSTEEEEDEEDETEEKKNQQIATTPARRDEQGEHEEKEKNSDTASNSLEIQVTSSTPTPTSSPSSAKEEESSPSGPSPPRMLSRSRSSSISNTSPRSYSDSKQRLNILVADVSEEGFEATQRALKHVLLPYERWVVSCSHCASDVEMLERLFTTSSDIVSKMDVILVDESVCALVMDRHDADVKALIEDVKNASNKAIVGLTLTADSEQHDLFKNEAKRGKIDFIWDKPILKFVSMLPLLLHAA